MTAIDSTGASLPPATGTPWARKVFHRYAPFTRSGPSRASAQYMSLVQCVGCIEGITPRPLNRGTSAGAITCACSIRKR